MSITGLTVTPQYNGLYTIGSIVSNGLGFTYTDNSVTNGAADAGGTATPTLGGAQRSMVDSIVLTFDQPETLGAGAFTLSFA